MQGKYEHRKYGETKKCIICNREFYVKQSHKERRKTCSKECRFKLQAKHLIGNSYRGEGIKSICITCNKEFKFSPSQNKKYCSQKCYKLEGNKNPNWRGDVVGYGGIHKWIAKQLGKPRFCEECKAHGDNMKFEWANISREYKRDVTDWKRLCISCHKKFDNAIENIKKREVY